MSGQGYRMMRAMSMALERPASKMSDQEIERHKAWLGRWIDATRGREGVEWMVERMGELETEQKRRRAASKEKT